MIWSHDSWMDRSLCCSPTNVLISWGCLIRVLLNGGCPPLISLCFGTSYCDLFSPISNLYSNFLQDYNFLDYNEKVIDGFYDIFGLSGESARQGKMPSLAELQTSIGDLGFEVIVVDHKFDSALQEMMEVAQCCMLGCPDTTVLVRRIAEVVAGHMGGPVIDATEMFTKWLGKSIEQRTSHQTSLLPIGRIDIGLSRHRALLFKVRSLPFRRCVEWQLPTFQLIYWLTCLFHQKEKSKPYFLH